MIFENVWEPLGNVCLEVTKLPHSFAKIIGNYAENV